MGWCYGAIWLFKWAHVNWRERELVRERSKSLRVAGGVELGRQLELREPEKIGHGYGPIRERESVQVDGLLPVGEP